MAAPRRQARPARPVQRPSTRAFDRIEAGADVAERLKRRPFEHVETQAGEAASASPLFRIRAHRPYGLAAMQQIGLVSTLVLSIVADGCVLDWDPANGPAPPILLPNLPAARAEAAYVSEAAPCSRALAAT